MWTGEERAVSEAMLICCLLALAGLTRVGPREALGTPGVLILFCLMSYAGIGMTVAIVAGADLREAQWYLVRHVNSALVIIAAAVSGRVLLRRAGSERVMRGLLLVMTAGCTLILASPWLLSILRFPPLAGEYRFFGSFTDPNEAGLMACFTVVTALALIDSGRSRVFALGALLVGVAAVAGTFSRTAFIVLPLVLLGSLPASRGAGRKRIAGSVAVVAVAVAGALAAVDMDTLDQRGVSRWNSLIEVVGSSSVEDTSLADRSRLWSLALEQTLDAPLLGSGLGRLHSLDGAWYNREGVLLGAHNQYLILAGEAGFLPLALFVLFLVVTFQAGFRTKTDRPFVWSLGAVSGWTIVLIVFSMTFHGILTYRICNFIIGLICAVTASCPRHEVSRPETT
ncbi:MAG: O-antigen ligase family protein [Spirochaetaceae bacterium]|nr:O-antigen ligase family protein [Spirochaetaceae bacterium]